TAATIGHAVSTDLVAWEVRPDALGPAPGGWDDLALWTGSGARHPAGPWRLSYTALSTAGRGVLDQRLGMAESSDLETWHRVGDAPVLPVDPRWYKVLDDGSGASETSRDPVLFPNPGDDGWHMIVPARLRGAPRFDDGVLAHARSPDRHAWTLGPPISEPHG